MNRRRVLIGTAVGAAAGVGAIAEIGWTNLLRKTGFVMEPDHRAKPSGLLVATSSFDSVHMGGAVGWSRVAVTETPEALLVCLHGKGNDHRFTFDTIHLHDVAAAVDAPLVIVSVDGGADSYWHARAAGVDPQLMLTEELLPLVSTTIGGDLPCYLMGWSMGGYGALLAAETHPGRFAGVVAASPALFPTFDDVTPGAFDDAADLEAHDVFVGVASLLDPPIPVRIDCGTRDPFIDAARRFADQVPDAVTSWDDAAHNEGYWRSVAPRQIATILDWMP